MDRENENLTPETEEEEGPIYLTDEDGKEYPFDLLDIISYRGSDYAVFFPAGDPEEDDNQEEEVVILKVIPHKDGSVEFEGTDDEAVLDTVFETFMENMRRAFEEEDSHGDGCGCGHCHK